MNGSSLVVNEDLRIISAPPTTLVITRKQKRDHEMHIQAKPLFDQLKLQGSLPGGRSVMVGQEQGAEFFRDEFLGAYVHCWLMDTPEFSGDQNPEKGKIEL